MYGISAGNLIAYLLMSGFILILFYGLWQQGQFKKFVTGAVLCEFETHTGMIYFRVLPTSGKQVLPPQGKWLKRKEKNKEVPKNWNYLLPDNMPTIKYPLGGWPAFLKVDVRLVRYVEGNPQPKMFDNKLPAMDSEALTAMQNMAVLKMAFTELLRDMTDTLKDKASKLLLYVAIGAIAMSAISAIIAYMGYAKLGDISTLLKTMFGG